MLILIIERRKVTILQTSEAFANNFTKTQNINILLQSFLPTGAYALQSKGGKHYNSSLKIKHRNTM